MKRLSLVVVVVALATGVLGQVSLKSTAPPTGGGGGGPVVYDAVSTSAIATAPITWSHTVTGTNTALVVSVSGAAFQVHSTCTYNGVSMSEVAHMDVDAFRGVTMLALAPAATGTHDVVCSNVSGGSIRGAGISVTGANQTTPVRAFQTASNPSGTSSVTVTSATNDLVVDVALASTNGTIAADGTQSQKYEAADDSGDATKRFGGSTKAGASSVTMQWTWTSTVDPWVAIAASIQP